MNKESIEKEREKMKKIFSKLENKNDEKIPSNYVTNYTGKVFQINKHSVTVEEILAEGKERLKQTKLIFMIFFLNIFVLSIFLLIPLLQEVSQSCF